MPETDGPIVINSIGALIKYGYSLSVCCNARDCWNQGNVDLQKLGERIGFNHSHLHDAIKRYFRCSKCGSKDVGFRLSTNHPMSNALERTHLPVSTSVVGNQSPPEPKGRRRRRRSRR